MRSRLPLIIIAILLAGLVTFVVFQDRENYRRKVRKEFAKMAQGLEPVPVVIAARDVNKRGTIHTEEMIRLEKIPEKALQPYAVQDVADALGKEPLGPLAQGQQLLRNQLVIPGTTSTSLATKIPPDKRAISIEITPITSIDRIQVGNGLVGAVTRRLQESFFDVIQGRTRDRHGWLFPIEAKGKVQRAAKKAR